MATGDAAAALTQFQLGLTLYHGRTNLLLGAARAADRLNRSELALRYYGQLAENWVNAESYHPFVAEARAGAAQ